MPTIPLRDGNHLYVRVIGQGKPVVMLHGLGMHSRHWLPFVWPLRHRFRFYMPDFRGAGRSARVGFNQRNVFQNHKEDLEDMMTALKLNDVLLVGYSLGASTSLQWQNDGGFDKVSAYLHIEQSPCVINQGDWQEGLFGSQQEWVYARLKRLRLLLEDREEKSIRRLPESVRLKLVSEMAGIFAKVSGKKIVAPLFRLAGRLPFVMPLILPMTRLEDIRAYLASYTELGSNYLPALKGCTTPITVVTGAKSPLYSVAGQRAIIEDVKYGRQVVLSRTGHVPLLDQPLAFNRVLKRFLYESA